MPIVPCTQIGRQRLLCVRKRCGHDSHVTAPEFEHGTSHKLERLWNVKSLCQNKSIIMNCLDGGGGGSRTPVRKALRPEAYMLSSIPFFSPTTLRMSKKRGRLVRWFSPAHHGP